MILIFVVGGEKEGRNQEKKQRTSTTTNKAKIIKSNSFLGRDRKKKQYCYSNIGEKTLQTVSTTTIPACLL